MQVSSVIEAELRVRRPHTLSNNNGSSARHDVACEFEVEQVRPSVHPSKLCDAVGTSEFECRIYGTTESSRGLVMM